MQVACVAWLLLVDYEFATSPRMLDTELIEQTEWTAQEDYVYDIFHCPLTASGKAIVAASYRL